MKDEGGSIQEYPAYLEKTTKRPGMVVIIAAVIVFIAIVLGGLYLVGALSGKKGSKVAALPTPTAAPIPTDTPVSTISASLTATPSAATPTLKASPTAGKTTPAPSAATTLDRSKLNIEILNGSGEKGAASSVSTYLSGLGYTIKSVGNADSFTYENITVKATKSKSVYLSQLKKDLTDNFPSTTVTASVSDSLDADAVVIVGK